MHDPPASDANRSESLARLAGRLVAGDEQAFEEIHRRLGGGLRRYFLERNGGRAELADELAQQTWVAVWRAVRGGRYDPRRSAVSTFVYAVGCKTWLQHCRQTRRATPPVDARALEADSGNDASDELGAALDLSERIEALRDCLRDGGSAAGLTPGEHALLLGIADGLSLRELAERLDLAPSTVSDRKSLAINKLRSWFARRRGPRSAERPPSPGG